MKDDNRLKEVLDLQKKEVLWTVMKYVSGGLAAMSLMGLLYLSFWC
jgi:hypothetical protein